MSFDNHDGDRPRKAENKGDRVGSGGARAARADSKERKPEVGSALRSIYQRTVDESIPPEMLDLLGKLG